MTIVNSTTARNKLFKIIEETLETHEPIIITGKHGNVVLISEEDYRAIQETLYLNGIPGLKDKLLRGKDTPLEKCVEDAD